MSKLHGTGRNPPPGGGVAAVGRHTDRLKRIIGSLAASSSSDFILRTLISEGEFGSYSAYLQQLLHVKVGFPKRTVAEHSFDWQTIAASFIYRCKMHWLLEVDVDIMNGMNTPPPPKPYLDLHCLSAFFKFKLLDSGSF
jgi:hypothetical protein